VSLRICEVCGNKMSIVEIKVLSVCGSLATLHMAHKMLLEVSILFGSSPTF
jgi:phosphopantetheine adenylyltransferase